MKQTILIFLTTFLIIASIAGLAAAESPTSNPMHEVTRAQAQQVQAPWLLHPPTIDGDLSDWAGQSKIILNGDTADYPGGSELLPDSDLSAWASVIWTSQRVYIAISVVDDYVVSGSLMWRHDDMASVVFDVDNSGDFSSSDLDLTLSPNNVLTVNGGWPAGYEWAIHTTDNGWQGEVSIPMAQFNNSDFLGDTQVGFTWGVQDNDGVGIESWLSWAGPEYLHPTTQEGQLTFSDGPIRKWVAFHPGVNGYDGIIDSSLDSWHPNQRHGNDQDLVLYSRNAYHLVLKFDFPDLGQDVRVLDARVHINFTSRNHDWTSNYKIYRLSRPWDEATVTWVNADAATPWGIPGAGAVGADREGRVIGAGSLDKLGWKTFDIAGDVATDMYEHPENNHGIIIRAEGGSSVAYHLASSEAASANAPWVEIYAEFPPE